LVDALAAGGTWAVVAWCETDPITGCVVVAAELPRVADPVSFEALLGVVGDAAGDAGLGALILRGHPPPVDATVAFSALTPDPAVLEVNHAPAADASGFAHAMREVFAAAHAAGLEPYRLQYDGNVGDSGGAGHLTLGGPSPAASPFFVAPRLLPRLIRYLNRHPALSYWFCRFPGGCGQSPRTDEGTRESFAELELALARLDREPAVEPSLLARTIAPFLVDPSGNPHRSELNVEKLWNDALPGRGHLGLVEFRAFGMARSADVLTARACLLRALAAMLARVEVSHGLERWGDDLHDRFALPFHLRRDLLAVASDLAAAGLALPPPVLDLLLADEARTLATVAIDGCTLEIEQAVEFWPLVGDVASQEGGGSRLVDPSTTRLQVTLRVTEGARHSLHAWRLGAEGHLVRLQDEHDAHGPLKLGAVRYRTFLPGVGLHPSIPALPQLRLTLQRAGAADGLEVVVHGWRPDGEAYDGLPADLEAAAARRRERVVARRVILETPLLPPPTAATTAWALDLRAL
ncbi:transglutaminase family protein, partial [Candidatus Binatia bacterium]|nr:transglutaminase family protein [Candidatus Binatia bacterium]